MNIPNMLNVHSFGTQHEFISHSVLFFQKKIDFKYRITETEQSSTQYTNNNDSIRFFFLFSFHSNTFKETKRFTLEYQKTTLSISEWLQLRDTLSSKECFSSDWIRLVRFKILKFIRPPIKISWHYSPMFTIYAIMNLNWWMVQVPISIIWYFFLFHSHTIFDDRCAHLQ